MIYAFLKALASAITSIEYSIVFALVASSYRHFSRLIPHQEFEYDIYAEILSLAVVVVNRSAVLPFLYLFISSSLRLADGIIELRV